MHTRLLSPASGYGYAGAFGYVQTAVKEGSNRLNAPQLA